MSARRIVASGSVRIKDDEIFSDDYGTLSITSGGVLSSNQPSVNLVNTSKCVGGEVRFELQLDATLLDNGSIRVQGEARLFEGTSCSTNDLEDTQSINMLVPKDGSSRFDIRVESTGAGGGDWAKGRISVTNTAQATPLESSPAVFEIHKDGSATLSPEATELMQAGETDSEPASEESIFGSKHTYCCSMGNNGRVSKKQQFRSYSWQAPLFCMRMARSNGYNSGSVSRGRCENDDFEE